MKRTFITKSIFFLLAIMLISCRHTVTPQNSSQPGDAKGQNVASPPCIIYKTSHDYYHLVPVSMNAEKTKITSYPDRKDIYYQGRLAYPTQLLNGFLLDNRGIGPNVAFLDFTYEEYERLDVTPSMEELMNHILDKDPLTEMYQCGNKIDFKDLEKDLNELIASGKLSLYKRIK